METVQVQVECQQRSNPAMRTVSMTAVAKSFPHMSHRARRVLELPQTIAGRVQNVCESLHQLSSYERGFTVAALTGPILRQKHFASFCGRRGCEHLSLGRSRRWSLENSEPRPAYDCFDSVALPTIVWSFLRHILGQVMSSSFLFRSCHSAPRTSCPLPCTQSVMVI